MLEPRPEMRTATRFLRMRSPGEFEASAMGDARRVRVGTWESARVQWLDRGYTGAGPSARHRVSPRRCASRCSRFARGGGAGGPSRGADLSIPKLITLCRILSVPGVVSAV